MAQRRDGNPQFIAAADHPEFLPGSVGECGTFQVQAQSLPPQLESRRDFARASQHSRNGHPETPTTTALPEHSALVSMTRRATCYRQDCSTEKSKPSALPCKQQSMMCSEPGPNGPDSREGQSLHGKTPVMAINWALPAWRFGVRACREKVTRSRDLNHSLT